jgi:xanthine dehydrogenase YagS FAD-binding subunit
MNFAYVRAASVADAVNTLSADPGAALIAGGTNLVDLMKYNVSRPTSVVDISGLPLRDIVDSEHDGLMVGALVSNADLAYDERIRRRYPLLSSAILAGASPQLRNAATTGGNLLQRTRCYYFYDPKVPCNKRDPGSGCPAIEGLNRIHAILGASERCAATHPSDMCVALAALEAIVHVVSPRGKRTIAFSEFHRLPGDQPERDNTLERDELITAVELPKAEFAKHYSYLKLRDRASYAFALVSVAAALRMEGGMIARARLALGGVAHKPWRDASVEAMLEGRASSPDLFDAAAEAMLAGARGYRHNAFKIPLARKAIARALAQASAATPQSQTVKTIL